MFLFILTIFEVIKKNYFQACSRLFQTTLVEIRDKIDPILKSTCSKEEPVKKEKEMSEKERRHEETKTRWESKENVKEELLDADVNDVDKSNA